MRRAFCLLALWGVLCVAGEACAAPPQLTSAAGILIDAASGRVLFAKSAYVRRAPASTTKLLTALVAERAGGLQRTVRVSRQAASVVGSSAHLSAGEVYTLRELLEGMLLRSGNDAAWAIAEHVGGGDVGLFMRQANEQAIRLGARQTHFVNPHGLTASHHYTSARDLSLIARTALREPEIRRIVASQELTLTPVGRGGRTIRNTNQLLSGYLGADGAKTGTTNAAGKCLVASATRGGVQLIAVVLKGGDRYGDATRLLDWGFARVTEGPNLAAGTAFGRLADGRVPRLAHQLAAPVVEDVPVRLSLRLDPHPARGGGVVGAALLLAGEDLVDASPLMAGPLATPFWVRLLHPLLQAPVDRPSLHSL